MQDFAAHPGHIASNTTLYQGRYRVDLLLSETPLLAIYRGWDITQQRPVTILELATPDPTVAAVALEHAVPLIQLDHALLRPIQVLFVENNTFFVALALAGGQTLEHIMEGRASPISPAAAVRWIAQVGEGVEFLAHELPSWHLGDLSPASLLVTAEDRVQILNFSVALGLLTPARVAAALPAGDVAPEMAEGQCDARSDVYSLAATLYFLLACRRWPGANSPAPEALAAQRPELSPAFVAAVMRGLAPVPDHRWPDAATFYQELLRALPGGRAIDNAALLWGMGSSQLDELADEPPTLVTTRDQLQAAMQAERARLEQESAKTESAAETPAPLMANEPVETYIILTPDKPPAEQETIPATSADAPVSDAIPDTVLRPEPVAPTVVRTGQVETMPLRIYDLPAAREALYAATFTAPAHEQPVEPSLFPANVGTAPDKAPEETNNIRHADVSPEPVETHASETAGEWQSSDENVAAEGQSFRAGQDQVPTDAAHGQTFLSAPADEEEIAAASASAAIAPADDGDLVASPTLPRSSRDGAPAEPAAGPSPPAETHPDMPETTATSAKLTDEQLIVAHAESQPSEPPANTDGAAQSNEQASAGRTSGGIAVGGLLDRLRSLLHVPGPMPSLATGTVVVPRHMYPQHTYSILVRLQSRGMPEPSKTATFVLVEVEAAPDAFYVPVKRLALRLPIEGGLSEGSIAVTAKRSSPDSTDSLTFNFRSSDGTILHEGQFLAEVAILAPQQLASGAPMLTLVHALDIERMIS